MRVRTLRDRRRRPRCVDPAPRLQKTVPGAPLYGPIELRSNLDRKLCLMIMRPHRNLEGHLFKELYLGAGAHGWPPDCPQQHHPHERHNQPQGNPQCARNLPNRIRRWRIAVGPVAFVVAHIQKSAQTAKKVVGLKVIMQPARRTARATHTKGPRDVAQEPLQQ